MKWAPSGLGPHLRTPGVETDLRTQYSAAQCPTLCDPMGCPWDSPGKKTGVSSHALSRGIFPTQGKSKPTSPALADRFSTTEPTWEAHEHCFYVLERTSKNGCHQCLCPQGELQLHPAFPGDSPRSSGRSDPGSHHTLLLPWVPEYVRLLCVPIKSEVSISPSPLGLLK